MQCQTSIPGLSGSSPITHMRLFAWADGGCGASDVLPKFDPLSGSVENFTSSSCLTLLCTIHFYSVTTIEGLQNTSLQEYNMLLLSKWTFLLAILWTTKSPAANDIAQNQHTERAHISHDAANCGQSDNKVASFCSTPGTRSILRRGEELSCDEHANPIGQLIVVRQFRWPVKHINTQIMRSPEG